MLTKFRGRVEDEKGFTLVELLVVILIIGILAAIAIPAFLNQRGKAFDASAKSQVTTLHTAMETYATGNGGSGYTGATLASLQSIEPTLNDTASATPLVVGTPTQSGYTVDSTAASTGDVFYMTLNNGTETRTCTSGGNAGSPGGCTVPTGSASGTW